MATILPKKAGFEQPMALDDDHYTTLAADPSINQFPQGSSYGSTSFGNNNMSAGGFGSSGLFSNPSFNQQQTPSFGGTQNVNQSNSNQPVLTGAALPEIKHATINSHSMRRVGVIKTRKTIIYLHVVSTTACKNEATSTKRWAPLSPPD